jgi:hypothetical protein
MSVEPAGSFFNTPLAVAMGLIPGTSSMNKFGENPEVATGTDPEDIWDYGGLYTFSTTADIDQVSSSDDGDTQDVTFIGLGDDWSEVTQIVTLTGQTPATLDTPLRRIYRGYNSNATDFVGDIYVTTNGATLSSGVPTVANTVRCMIRGANNQTLMCIYTVPAGKTAYFMSGYVAMSGTGVQAESSKFSWNARPFGGVFQVKSKLSCVTTGGSTWFYHYGVPVALPEKTDVKITSLEVTATMPVSGGFDLILVDN